jgi:ornithine cyclodeaminase
MSDAEYSAAAGLRYLCRTDVVSACRGIDPVAVVREALRLHAEGRTTLPNEAYLHWTTTGGAAARSLALPGALWGDEPALGLKVINSSLANAGNGIPRAHGLTLLFDPETARPMAVMEAAHVSALRTAAYTALSVELLAAETDTVAIIGCGMLGQTHAELLAERLPAAQFRCYDIIAAARDRVVEGLLHSGVTASAASSAEDATRPAGVVVTTTTTTTGYLPHAWLRPGALVAHVSLDDVLSEVVERADLVFVDDWGLVSGDTRRLLGRMYHAGTLIGPDHEAHADEATRARRVDASLGAVLVRQHPGRANDRQVILSNPFGMGILDVALAAEVWRVARRRNLGVMLPP